jgi:RNA polymerase sigma factor (sigma-70 family)
MTGENRARDCQRIGVRETLSRDQEPGMGRAGLEIHENLERIFAGGVLGGLTDGQLINRFLAERDELAFEVLVRRHGPMVRGVCLGVLGPAAEADDAFQAAFLLLARKGRLIRGRDSVAGWLHRVAHRMAWRAHRQGRRRGCVTGLKVEQVPDPAGSAAEAAIVREQHLLVRQEVDRLPERYRSPVVLCDLEGLTHEEAAARLACPVGTVKGRLSRARERLRGRLLRRGLGPLAVDAQVGALGAATSAWRVAVSEALARQTAHAALLVLERGTAAAVTAGAVPAAVGILAIGAARAMFWTKLGAALGGLALTGTLVGGAAAIGGAGDEPGKTQTPESPKPAERVAMPKAHDLFFQLQGFWGIASIEVNGKDAGSPHDTPVRFNGNAVEGLPLLFDPKATFQVGESDGHLDMMTSLGPLLTRVRLEGDRLQMAYIPSLVGKPETRPRQLGSHDAPGHVLVKMQRLSPAEEQILFDDQYRMRRGLSKPDPDFVASPYHHTNRPPIPSAVLIRKAEPIATLGEREKTLIGELETVRRELWLLGEDLIDAQKRNAQFVARMRQREIEALLKLEPNLLQELDTVQKQLRSLVVVEADRPARDSPQGGIPPINPRAQQQAMMAQIAAMMGQMERVDGAASPKGGGGVPPAPIGNDPQAELLAIEVEADREAILNLSRRLSELELQELDPARFASPEAAADAMKDRDTQVERLTRQLTERKQQFLTRVSDLADRRGKARAKPAEAPVAPESRMLDERLDRLERLIESLRPPNVAP